MMKIIEWVGNVICSAFLTYIVDTVTLSTNLQVGFVFCYFILVNRVLNIIYRSKSQQSCLWKKISLFFVALGVAILTLSQVYTTEYSTNIVLTVNGEKNQEAFGSEIWLTHIFVNGIAVQLENISLEGGWKYADSDDAIYIVSEDGKEESLELGLPAGKIVTLVFNSHPWSGIVEIEGGTLPEKIDLYSKDNDSVTIDVVRMPKQPHFFVKVMLCIGYAITLYRLFSLLLLCLNKRGD